MQSTNYFTRLGGAVSRVFNVLLFNGHPAESISARAYRLSKERPERLTPKIFYRLINGIFYWQEDHCKASYMDDMAWAKSRLTGYTPSAKEN